MTLLLDLAILVSSVRERGVTCRGVGALLTETLGCRCIVCIVAIVRLKLDGCMGVMDTV